jgi:hypothetical protein
MKPMGIIRWCLAGAAVTALAFGATQVFAAPGAHAAKSWCDPWQCATTGCPPGCGPGTCVNNECECNC